MEVPRKTRTLSKLYIIITVFSFAEQTSKHPQAHSEPEIYGRHSERKLGLLGTKYGKILYNVRPPSYKLVYKPQ
jgi:hypothetical protein